MQWLEGLEEDLDSRGGVGSVAALDWLGPELGIFRGEGIACKVVLGPLGAAVPVLLLQGLAAKDSSHLPEGMQGRAAGKIVGKASLDSGYDQLLQEEVQLGLQQQEACLFAAVQLLLKVGLLEETWATAGSRNNSARNSSSSSSSQADIIISYNRSKQPSRGSCSQNSSSSSCGSSNGPEMPAAVAVCDAALRGRLQKHKQQKDAPGLAGLKEVLQGILKMPAEGQLQVCAGRTHGTLMESSSVILSLC